MRRGGGAKKHIIEDQKGEVWLLEEPPDKEGRLQLPAVGALRCGVVAEAK